MKWRLASVCAFTVQEHSSGAHRPCFQLAIKNKVDTFSLVYSHWEGSVQGHTAASVFQCQHRSAELSSQRSRSYMPNPAAKGETVPPLSVSISSEAR